MQSWQNKFLLNCKCHMLCFVQRCSMVEAKLLLSKSVNTFIRFSPQGSASAAWIVVHVYLTNIRNKPACKYRWHVNHAPGKCVLILYEQKLNHQDGSTCNTKNTLWTLFLFLGCGQAGAIRSRVQDLHAAFHHFPLATRIRRPVRAPSLSLQHFV